MRRRFLHPLWLIFALPGYIGLRLIPPLTEGAAAAGLAVAALLLACVLVPLSVNARAFHNRAFADRLSWIGLLAMGFFATLFIMALLRDVFLFAVLVVTPAHSTSAFTVPSARWVVALSVLSCLCGFVIARRPRLRTVDIAIEGLPPALAGFTIAQITDLHVGPTIKRRFVENIVARVNRLQADVVAITGDLIDGSVADLRPHTAPLAGLRGRDGVYFVTGNHEYYSGEPAWSAEVRRLGITVLKNEHVVIERDGVKLVLAGITDYTAHHFDPAQRSDAQRALQGAPPSAAVKVLLAHQPSSATEAAAAGFDLQVSGHTHGGQFWPWNFFVRYFQPFTAGLHRLGSLQVYVSTGTGYWGPPNRFFVPGEITRLRLVAAR